MEKIKLYNAHCCGEIGDVIVSGKINLEGNTILEQSKYLFDDKKLRKFLLNEPRGGVFKHYNLLVPPKNEKAKAAFIIMEPEDNPPMSGSNSICVATVLLEKGIIDIKEPITEFLLEAPAASAPVPDPKTTATPSAVATITLPIKIVSFLASPTIFACHPPLRADRDILFLLG